MKEGAKYDKHRVPEQVNTGSTGIKHEDSNPWRKKDKEKEKVDKRDEMNPNYYFIVPWQMY